LKAMPYTLIQDAAFDPEVTRLLGLAFDDACTRAGGDKSMREAIAMRIIAAARDGERDVHKLAAYGLNGHR
jgi:hypothetical protein